ncbi:E3 ubiquitin-protein ligase RGLG4 [Sesamum angolense]|uniref:E3 ubiquitin-protein ligase RGLG4 n=1 Tax=Sesamum angolense TaxID=2727404 RepID=A0AAE2BUZ3_9LAMI|nr:E3 ubiquitin-protein ligase RGLG4 [Sesamum angolense]
MGNRLFRSSKRSSSESSVVAGGGASSIIPGPTRSTSYSVINKPFDGLPQRNRNHSSSTANFSDTKNTTGSAGGTTSTSSGVDKKKKYGFIPDNFTSVDQVTAALRESGLESSNLILGIDFTKSNEWTGKVSFSNRSLHAVGDTPNPYEKAISIIGKTLAPFDEDNLIPCFGFGDATTHDQEVFSFHSDHSPCHGFEEVLACYRRIVPNLRLSGPTSYGPVVDAAVDIVERSGGQYHVLVIIADGQVTRSVNTSDAELSPQEEKTINSIVNASLHPLSIILVGVGDGPWEDMKKFDDKIPARELDNFQFVNFTDIMSKHTSSSAKEAAFALAALMEIPIQYGAAKEFGLLGRVTGKAKKIVPRPPPVPYAPRQDFHPENPAMFQQLCKTSDISLLNQWERHGLWLWTHDLQRMQPEIVRVSYLSATYHKSAQAIYLMFASI